MSLWYIYESSLEKFFVFWPSSHQFNFSLGDYYALVSFFQLKFNIKIFSKFLLFIWSSHSSKINRRSIYIFGFFALGLLVFQSGWEVSRAFTEQSFPNVWPFNLRILMDSSTWFYALVQVIFSTNIGVGAIPVISGKFLYKGDAVK